MKSVFLKTFGCQMNFYDSQVILEQMKRCGYKETNDERAANLIILNTCSIRAHAEERVFSKLGEIKKLKQEKKELIVGICGCMAQYHRRALFERFKFLDFIVSPSNINRLQNIIEEIKEDKTKVAYLGNFKNSLKNINPDKKGKVSAYLPIMFGCSNFCSYCVVPFLRGKSRSRKLKEIIKEVKELSNQGCREVVLVGQNVTFYGKDLNNEATFSNLLKEINSIENIKRIRFITSHPKDLSEDIINCFSKFPKVCPHIHLPIQSGSDKILSLMNRGYTIKTYQDLVEKLRKEVKNISITTDIMVGFPDETQEDFKDTLNLVEEIKFDQAFTFKYSPRKDTLAFKMKNQVEDKIAKERLQALITFQNKISKKNNEKYLSSIQEVLVEGESSKYEDRLYGRTDNFKTVLFDGSKDIVGRLVKVVIVGYNMRTLKGNILND
ncbi:MAG: tRNA (N6-isopentenyl adenosine(37)-C2)-methylthiotransferase MiaB [bacterium]|nr:tRNA (N6-isopentenyl adenosine(37)-C2)-methylthiotransferase MiaB [bacterium]